MLVIYENLENLNILNLRDNKTIRSEDITSAIHYWQQALHSITHLVEHLVLCIFKVSLSFTVWLKKKIFWPL